MVRTASIFLWFAFAMLLLAAGVMFTRACGAGIGFIDFCAEPRSELSVLKSRNEALISERATYITQLRRTSECRAPEAEAPSQSDQAALQCQPPATQETLVLVDVSLSMAADFDLPPGLIAAMDRNYQAMRAPRSRLETMMLEAEVDRLYNRADTPKRPDRIDVAREALRPLLAGLSNGASLKLMSFASCGRAVQHEGTFFSADQPAYDLALNNLRLRSMTALAEAIDQLPQQTTAGRSPDRPVNIIIMADGEDNCSGDPCASAARLRQALPNANVSVVAIGNLASATRCIAEQAGGQFLTAATAQELDLRLRQTAGQLDAAECASLGNPAPRAE